MGGAGAFAVYFVFSLLLLAVFIAVYMAVTPYRELGLIRSGNRAAALSLGGAVLGFSIPLAKSVEQSAGLGDMVVWALIALVAQLLAYFAARMLLPHLRESIAGDQVASGIFLAALSVAIGMLNAASMAA